jgi:hypothetical protein
MTVLTLTYGIQQQQQQQQQESTLAISDKPLCPAHPSIVDQRFFQVGENTKIYRNIHQISVDKGVISSGRSRL